jgi:hypothetical protein
VEDLRSTHQFLNILAAEANHFVTVSITLSDDEKNDFENDLSSAFVSDSFSDTVNAWNAERRSESSLRPSTNISYPTELNGPASGYERK